MNNDLTSNSSRPDSLHRWAECELGMIKMASEQAAVTVADWLDYRQSTFTNPDEELVFMAVRPELHERIHVLLIEDVVEEVSLCFSAEVFQAMTPVVECFLAQKESQDT